MRVEGDTALYVVISGSLGAILAFLAPLIGKWMQRPTEKAATKRADFESTMEAMRQLMDLKDAEIARLIERHRVDGEEWDAKTDDLEARLQKRRDEVHLLNNLLQSYVLRFGRIEGLPDEDGGTSNA